MIRFGRGGGSFSAPHVMHQVPISVSEAVLGATITVPTIKGEVEVTVRIARALPCVRATELRNALCRYRRARLAMTC